MKGLDDFISKPMIFQIHGAQEKHSLATNFLPYLIIMRAQGVFYGRRIQGGAGKQKRHARASEKRGPKAGWQRGNLGESIRMNERGWGVFFFI